MTWQCGPSVDDVDDDLAPTCLMTWHNILRLEFRHCLVFSADFRQNFGELYRALFNSGFNDIYIVGLV
jgi:hypothetical protein